MEKLRQERGREVKKIAVVTGAAGSLGYVMQPAEIAAWVHVLVSPAGDTSGGNAIILNLGRNVR
ncbi:hypothetical protein [Roseobacter sp. OBYS 0001]|uniref:hypothetical protein n=1 Tax=Roseobacter sp. OBYS 0001 TaxID=882651 RepID=UPI001BBC0A96|nr:hypothetical protein [Roseobacter sp. OBYS 0001]GIT89102.1 hypothetical protein ROBYS_41180 [Roseobacter sp. OBYS 0001]